MASRYSYPAALLVFKHLNLHSRRLLLHNPLYLYPSPPTAAAASPPTVVSNNLQELSRQPSGTSDGFDTNVVMILSVLLCALICSIGLNSLIRCAVRCSSFASTTESSNNNLQQQQQQRSLAAVRRVTNTGIKQKALKTFPTINYSPDLKFPGLNTECVICLSEFGHGESLKILPKCNHGFHVLCIDQWLSSHSSCPTCRNCLIETCEKTVSCGSSEPAALVPEGSVVINMAPLEREDFVPIPRATAG